MKNPSLQAQTGAGAVVPILLSGVVTTEEPVVVVPETVVVGPGITVVVVPVMTVVDEPGITVEVVSTGAQKQHPSESISIFIPTAHWLIVQYGAQCN